MASSHYVKHGRPTGEFDNIRCALKSPKGLYGQTSADAFRPKDLELDRQSMIDGAPARKTIDGRVGRIRRMFRRAAREGIVPPRMSQGLTTIEGLKLGRSAAREKKPVTTVADDTVRREDPPPPASPREDHGRGPGARRDASAGSPSSA